MSWGHARSGVRWLAALTGLLLIAGTFVVMARDGTGVNGDPDERPSIVLILTDDQRLDSMFAMPRTRELLGGHGVTFENAFVVNSVCCPSRASILTGQYSHTTGVWSNRPPYGGFGAFDDTRTIATALDDAGYATAHVGKYLNGYYGTYEPPGWHHWFAFSGKAPYRQRDLYYDYFVNEDGELRYFGHDPQDYSTDAMAREAAGWIRGTEGPLFLQFAPAAPHIPATPSPQDAAAFDDLPEWDPPAYNEDDVSDKPSWVRELPKLRPNEIPTIRRRQLQSLLAVDRAVEDIVDALRDSGRLENTMIVFASDNGYAWGEHRWKNKQTAYEHDIRVPLLIRYDRVLGSARTEDRFALNVDLAPTFAALAGVSLPRPDGRDLMPLLKGTATRWREDFLIEHRQDEGVFVLPSYCGVRTESHTYVRYFTGEEELYDLRLDPDQLENLASSPGETSVLEHLRARVRELCDPPPPDAPPGFP